jgi:predicted ATPase/DNA-binding winged helix-turn-helix (wHTH) protein
MAGPAVLEREVINFGPFTLTPGERLLTNAGVPVRLGARALDILITLATHPNVVISKKDLLARVWPDVTVEEGSLRFHLANLRRALGDGKEGARYITTLATRGYCFVAPVSRSSLRDGSYGELGDSVRYMNVPSRVIRMIGRDHDVARVSKRVIAERFVTIVGAGGIGKTTVAVAVVHELIDSFEGSVLFVDLGMLLEPRHVPSSVASMLGLSVRSEDPTPDLIAYLRDRHILLVLDTCEHLIDTVAHLAALIFSSAPRVHILATSREALRAGGEHIYNLAPLSCPPDRPGLTAPVVGTFPAVQLFLDRAAASGSQQPLGDSDAPVVAGICRKLDGMPLAIELAAGRIGAYCLQQTAGLLEQRLALLWQGRRTAPPRHQTLLATLGWSYNLLSELERVVLRRLAVFVGHFTLDAALAVVPGTLIDQRSVFGAIDSLVAKSLVAIVSADAGVRYRLLDATRAYVLDLIADEFEAADIAERHASYYRTWLEHVGSNWRRLSNRAERMSQLEALNDVRTALKWCFDRPGNIEIGIGLAWAAAPVFLSLSLLTDCHLWSERAILALKDEDRGGAEEMRLQGALGTALMFTRGGFDAASAALNRSRTIAEDRGVTLGQSLLLGPLYMLHWRPANFKDALRDAERSVVITRLVDDPDATALGHALLGVARHFTGDLAGARLELEAALSRGPSSGSRSSIYLGFDCYNWASILLARTLWLQGRPEQAIDIARRTLRDAEALDHPVTLLIVLHWTASVFLYTGDLRSAEEHIQRIITHSQAHSLRPYIATGLGLKGQLAIRRGDTGVGIESIQEALEQLHAARYELFTTSFNVSIAEGLAAHGRFAEGLARLDEAVGQVHAKGDVVFLPELLRLKGNLCLEMAGTGADEEAERWFLQSLESSRRLAARAWELRTAVDLASLLARKGQSGRARRLLQPVFEQFTEGFETADLVAARHVLEAFEGSQQR